MEYNDAHLSRKGPPTSDLSLSSDSAIILKAATGRKGLLETRFLNQWFHQRRESPFPATQLPRGQSSTCSSPPSRVKALRAELVLCQDLNCPSRGFVNARPGEGTRLRGPNTEGPGPPSEKCSSTNVEGGVGCPACCQSLSKCPASPEQRFRSLARGTGRCQGILCQHATSPPPPLTKFLCSPSLNRP